MAFNEEIVVYYELVGSTNILYSMVDFEMKNKMTALMMVGKLFHTKEQYNFLRPYIADFVYKTLMERYKGKATFYDKSYIRHTCSNKLTTRKTEYLSSYERATVSPIVYDNVVFDFTLTIWNNKPNDDFTEIRLAPEPNPQWNEMFTRLDSIVNKKKKFSIPWKELYYIYHNNGGAFQRNESVSQLYYKNALWEYSMGIYEVCLEDCKQVTNLDKSNVEAMILTAKCFIDMKDYYKCVDYCDIVLRIPDLKTNVREEIDFLRNKAIEFRSNL